MPARLKAEPPEFIRKLAALMPLEWRAMFGGFGIYSEGIFFGLVSSQGVPYLRVGENNRADFEKAGSEPFRPCMRGANAGGRTITMPYYEVPEKVLAKPATLRAWAAKALEAAVAAKQARPKRAPARRPSGR